MLENAYLYFQFSFELLNLPSFGGHGLLYDLESKNFIYLNLL